MAEYRAYRIKDGRISTPPNIIVADDDKRAIEQAKQLVDGADIELWDRARFVRGFRTTDPK
jgi:hypothetical protein